MFNFCEYVCTKDFNVRKHKVNESSIATMSHTNILRRSEMQKFNRGRTSSVGKALDCRAGGREFDSRGRTITQGLKITEK